MSHCCGSAWSLFMFETRGHKYGSKGLACLTGMVKNPSFVEEVRKKFNPEDEIIVVSFLYK